MAFLVALALFTTLGPASLAIPAPLSPPFRHWRTSKQGRLQGCNNVTHDITAFGASPSADAVTNQAAINAALASMKVCDTLLIPKGVYSVIGGIEGRNLRNATIVVNGELNFVDPTADAFKKWPVSGGGSHGGRFHGSYSDCFALYDSIDIAITSDSRGTFNGNGRVWWNKMIVGDLPQGRKRPKMLHVNHCADVLVENVDLVNSPSFNLQVDAVRAEIRFVNVETDRGYSQSLKKRSFGDIKSRIEEWLLDKAVKLLPSRLLQPEDLNTDGIDPSGTDIWIHDCKISNDDDSIAVKPSSRGGTGVDGTKYDCSQNMLIENMQLVGFGASIGSVPPSDKRNCVDGITMRNIFMPGTSKGVYVKSNGNDCIGEVSSQLTNLRFENMTILEPVWWAIFIGPQQQHEPNSALGLDCALIYPIAGSQCPTQGCSDFENITLKDITITNPVLSPGIILGNASNPMRNLVFDNVVVKQDSLVLGRYPWHEAKFPWTGTYKSINAVGVCIDCHPVPEGFTFTSRKSYNETAQNFMV